VYKRLPLACFVKAAYVATWLKGPCFMSKYQRLLRFGYSLRPTAEDLKQSLQLATLAEELGLDYVGIHDLPDNALDHDMWTLFTAIGVATSRISLFTNVADLQSRPPTMLAKAVASLDSLTGSRRVEVGLRAGALTNPIVDRGGEKSSDKEALDALEEAIQAMRLMWAGERSTSLTANEQSGSTSVQSIGIWLAAIEPHTLELAARLADGWIFASHLVIQPDALMMLSKQIDEAAASTGREASDIQRILNISGTIGNEDSDVPFQGSAKQWAESLARLALDVGIDTFLLLGGEDAEEQLEKFGKEVVPYTREIMAHAPGVTTGLSRAYQGAAASGATPAEEETDDVDWVDETSMESFPASDPPASSSFT
jgi:hypothetical protein